MTDAIQKAREAKAWNCDEWPEWLHKIVDQTNEVADRLDMSSEQAHAYAVLAALDAETPVTPADVGEEPVAFVLRSDVEKFDVDAGEIVDVRFFPRGTLRPDNQEPLYSATALERVVRERDEARRERDALAQKMDPGTDPALVSRIIMRSIENEMDARDAEAKLAEARKVIEDTRSIVCEGAAEGFNPLAGDWAERLYTNNGALSEVISPRRWIEETK